MATDKDTRAMIKFGRRAFMKYSGLGLAATVVGLVPEMPILGQVGWKAYAQSQKKLTDDWWEVASKYGKPTGKFGQVGSPVTLTVGYQPYPTPYWTSSVNKQGQFLLKYLPEGSKVVFFRSLTGPLITNNMLAGKNQIGYMAETPAVRTGDTIPCDMIACTGYDLGENSVILVQKDLFDEGKVKSAKDLEGEKLATPFGSWPHRLALTWMNQNNIKPTLLDQGPQLMLTNLRSKIIAAAFFAEPDATLAEKGNVARIWGTGLDIECSCSKYYPETAKHTFRVVGGLLAIFDWLRDRPDIVGAFLKAEEEARDMLTHDPDLAAYYIWSDIPEYAPEVIRSTLDTMVWDGRITPECKNHIKGVARMWRQLEILRGDRSKDPDKFIDEWADDRFLRLAIKELKAQGLWTSDKLPGFPKEIRPDQLKRHSWQKYKDIKLEDKPWKPTNA